VPNSSWLDQAVLTSRRPDNFTWRPFPSLAFAVTERPESVLRLERRPFART
jgi:hypothetical protein